MDYPWNNPQRIKPCVIGMSSDREKFLWDKELGLRGEYFMMSSERTVEQWAAEVPVEPK